MLSYYDWVVCRPSVNIIYGQVMIGLSLSSVSKRLLTDDNDNPIIIRPHIVLTDDDNDNPIIIRPHIVFTDERQQRPNHNKHNMWSCYDWVVVVVVYQ
jgi:hypothetical protein